MRRSLKEFDNFGEITKKITKKAEKEIIESFASLEKITKNINPIIILSQLLLFLLSYDNIEDENRRIILERKLEFLTGFLLARSCYEFTCKEDIIDEKMMEKVDKIFKILDDYFHALNSFTLFSNGKNKKNEVNIISDAEEFVLKRVKESSFWIRGDAYNHQFIKYSIDYYSKYDLWFKKHLGFTMNDAILIYKTILRLYEENFYRYQKIAKTKSKEYAKEILSKKNISEKELLKKEKNAYIFYLFSKSAEMFSFTVEELSEHSSISVEICNKIMFRFSQYFGYRNPEYRSTYLNAFNSPWDYNTLYERPVIKFQDKYFVPLLPLFPMVLFYSFHYDIWNDELFRDKYNEIRGKWLEEKTYQILCNIFPINEVYLNPKYPNGNEFSDILVIHDNNILIIQCKSKKLTYEARIGKSFEKLKNDLNKSVKASFDQAMSAKNYLKLSNSPEITIGNKKIKIDMQKVDDENLFLIGITLGQYANITTRLANINSTFSLIPQKEFLWAACLFDLDIIVEILEKPFYFIHYLINRLKIEKKDIHLEADEIDLLGYYLDQKLNFDREEFKKENQNLPFYIALGGYSKYVDDYIKNKHQLGENPDKPKIKILEKFEELIFTVNKLNTPFRTQIILRLLDLNLTEQEYILKSIKCCKEKYTNSNALGIFSISIHEMNLEIVFISLNVKSDYDELNSKLEYFSMLKKYKSKLKECIGLGWDSSSSNLIDVAFYTSYPWKYNKILEFLAEKNIKKGTFINFDELNII